MNRTAMVVEGGAMRGIFSCGILDTFLQHNFHPFDLCIGVSAGANNLSGYLSGMHGRNYKIYTDYSLRPEFISRKRCLRGGHLIDLDWLWEITIREIPLDYAAVDRHPAEYVVGVTRLDSGATEYLQPATDIDLAQLLKASSAVPLLYRSPVGLNGNTYVDGGISDPIPVREAVRRGARRVLVLRSRPYSYTMNTSKKHRISCCLLRKHPHLTDLIRRRAAVYNETLSYLRNPPPGIEITEITPPEGFAVTRLTIDRHELELAYRQGCDVGSTLVQEYPPTSARYTT